MRKKMMGKINENEKKIKLNEEKEE